MGHSDLDRFKPKFRADFSYFLGHNGPISDEPLLTAMAQVLPFLIQVNSMKMQICNFLFSANLHAVTLGPTSNVCLVTNLWHGPETAMFRGFGTGVVQIPEFLIEPITTFFPGFGLHGPNLIIFQGVWSSWHQTSVLSKNSDHHGRQIIVLSKDFAPRGTNKDFCQGFSSDKTCVIFYFNSGLGKEPAQRNLLLNQNTVCAEML